MKNQFDRFPIRFLTALLLGVLLLLLHGVVRGGVFAVLVPQNGSAWELSKLLYWPWLAAALLTRRLCGPDRRMDADLPGLVLAPPTLVLVLWGLTRAGAGGGVCLAVWVALLAVGMVLLPGAKPARRPVWLVLAAALGGAYILLTYLAPLCGPFLDPTDVAAMAVIPF